MTDPNPNLEHRLAELNQVATELRAARSAHGSRSQRLTVTVRVALGRAFLAAATALLSDPSSPRLALR